MFRQIAVLDKTGLTYWALDELQMYSENSIMVYYNVPNSDEEIIRRIGDADCVFLSWHTSINKHVLSRSKNLKYIGMCCSLYTSESANVDLNYATSKDITVTGIRDYGDEGLVEYIISELIRLIKGIGDNQWKSEPVELTKMRIGVIGLGSTGKLLAYSLQTFGSQVYYYSRSRNIEVEKDGIIYLPLNELLKITDVISIHLPKNTSILKKNEFKIFGNDKILINTSLGLTFEKSPFLNWISNKLNYAIFDCDGVGEHKKEFDKYPNIISTDIVSGWTTEAKDRLSKRVLDNLKNFIVNYQKLIC